VIPLIEFFDAASRRHNDVILQQAIRRMSGNDFLFQQESPSAHRAAHVQQMNCCVKKCHTFLRSTCGLQTAKISVLWTTRSGLSCSIMSTTDKSIVWTVDELKRRLIHLWCGLEQSIFGEAIDQWRGRH